ncbi:hypothetical protein [Parvibaculum sp.]|uniref:hypothetical protein n=1 Tax=Parvibaculum sp. TaxID=2024848 RepID=UPI00272F32E9|nr:hypothetical protein [Parvibaculum sp.]MDP1628189.1 hypothetical protein [Parvibaculum sp.]MDP3326899.1 hypothetical protein [Parvibaculum sp.]
MRLFIYLSNILAERAPSKEKTRIRNGETQHIQPKQRREEKTGATIAIPEEIFGLSNRLRACCLERQSSAGAGFLAREDFSGHQDGRTYRVSSGPRTIG